MKKKCSVKGGAFILLLAIAWFMPITVSADDDGMISDIVSESRSFVLLVQRLTPVTRSLRNKKRPPNTIPFTGQQPGSKEYSKSTNKPPNVTKKQFPHDRIIRHAAQKYGIPKHLIAAVITCESNWKPTALSRAGARGLMQVLPRTARGEFSIAAHQLWDPGVNIVVGTAYLRRLANKYDGHPLIMLAAYNAGPGRISSGQPLPRETRRYLSCVQTWFTKYQRTGR